MEQFDFILFGRQQGDLGDAQADAGRLY